MLDRNTLSATTVRTTRRLAFRNAALCVALLVVVSVFASLRPGTADAGMIVNIEQQGSDVVASYSGSIDLTGIGFNVVGSANVNRVWASGGSVHLQNGVATKVSLTDFGKTPWTVAPSAFGTGGSFVPDTVSAASGNAFGFQASGFFIEPTYVSGTTISGSMTFENQTLASLGINVGDGIMNATFSSGDTLTVNAMAPVPEPGTASTAAMAAVLLSGAAFARSRGRPSVSR